MILNKDKQLRIKNGVMYYEDNYGTIFCDALDQSNMVGGGNEVPRNEIENPERLKRIKQLHPKPSVLDYGCGSGMFVEFLNANGVHAVGYDKFSDKHNAEPLFNEYDIVVMVEVIEHLSSPFSELDHVYSKLKKGGKVYIETSFADWLTLDDAYIEPAVGHSTVWSHVGLTAMMVSKGFSEGNHINRNVRIYEKI